MARKKGRSRKKGTLSKKKKKQHRAEQTRRIARQPYNKDQKKGKGKFRKFR